MSIKQNLQNIKSQLPEHVALVAVSKTFVVHQTQTFSQKHPVVTTVKILQLKIILPVLFLLKTQSSPLLTKNFQRLFTLLIRLRKPSNQPILITKQIKNGHKSFGQNHTVWRIKWLNLQELELQSKKNDDFGF